MAAADAGGDVELFDGDLAPRFEIDGNDVEAHAGVAGGAGLAVAVADVLVAVGDQDDAVGGVVGEDRLRPLDRGGEVGEGCGVQLGDVLEAGCDLLAGGGFVAHGGHFLGVGRSRVRASPGR